MLFSVHQRVLAAPDISAASAILVTSEGEVIFEKNADTPLPMASTTKIMTCILALEMCDLNDRVRVPKDAVGVEGSSLYLSEGDTLTLEDLVYAAMLRSANDAAETLALRISGSDEAFAEVMNEKAASLGMTSTHFSNPHGLPGADHYTTARDFSRLAAYAMKNRTFAKIAGTKEYVVTVNGNEKHPVKNHNKLLFTYDGATGLKTGFTKASGRCLVSSAERDGVFLICVTLSDPDDWRDHAALFDYGFENYVHTEIIAKCEIKKTLHVFGDGYVTSSNKKPLSATVKRGAEISYVIEGDRFPAPPIEEGDVVATAKVYSNGVLVGSIPLVAENSITLPERKRLFGIF